MKLEIFGDEKITDELRNILDLLRKLKGQQKKNARAQLAYLLRKYDAWQLKFENKSLVEDLQKFQNQLKGQIHG